MKNRSKSKANVIMGMVEERLRERAIKDFRDDRAPWDDSDVERRVSMYRDRLCDKLIELL